MDTVDLEIRADYYDRLVARAKHEHVSPEVILERVCDAALDLPAPPYRLAMLLCSRCGTTQHRHSRTELRRGGVFVHFYGCTDCFRIRKHGEARVKETMAAPTELVPTEPAPRARPRLVAVSYWTRKSPAMEPGVPEALQ